MTLNIGALLAALAAITGVVTAILALTNGAQLLADEVLRQTGQTISPDTFTSSLGKIRNPLDILHNRAYLVIGSAVVALVWAILLRTGMTWARVLYSVAFLGSTGLLALDMSDTVQLIKILDGVNIAFAFLAIIFIWLGPSNAYNRARKSFKAARRGPVAR